MMDMNGTLAQTRGIEVCKHPIEEELYVRTHREDVRKHLVKKCNDIHSEISKSNDAILSSSSHANFLVFLYSY